MTALRAGLRQLRQYPSAIIGMTMVLILLGLSLVTVLTIPYSEAIRLWRGGRGVGRKPRARPAHVVSAVQRQEAAEDHHRRHAPGRESNG